LLKDTLKEAREKLGFSLARAARESHKFFAIDLSQDYLQRIESGYIPPPYILWKLAKLYKVSYQQLMIEAEYLVKKQRR